MHPVDNGNGADHGHDHEISPKNRRPANAVDPADVAARAYELADEVADELADARVPEGESGPETELEATSEVLETGLSEEAV
ncbi:unannotated protein [freshwater metagenome]|nr:hypothetical protein [Actinomycetota bacterium]